MEMNHGPSCFHFTFNTEVGLSLIDTYLHATDLYAFDESLLSILINFFTVLFKIGFHTSLFIVK